MKRVLSCLRIIKGSAIICLAFSVALSYPAFAQPQEPVPSSDHVVLDFLTLLGYPQQQSSATQSGPVVARSSNATPNFVYTQITNSLPPATMVARRAINENGRFVAFDSTADLDVTVGNSDGNIELFLFDRTTAVFTQITDTTTSASGEPAISADGTKIAFISSADLVPSIGNTDGSFEIFLLDLISETLQQVTNSAQNSARPSMSADGTKLVFHSKGNLDPLGTNADGSTEIFLFDIFAGTIQQLTDSEFASASSAQISADGSRIVFQSNSKEFLVNPEGSTEIVTFDLQTMTLGPATVTTICLGPVAPGPCTSNQPSISADGSRIVFSSNANFDLSVGNAEARPELFLWEPDAGAFRQLTRSEGWPVGFGGAQSEQISGDGTKVMFRSPVDLDPAVGNTDANYDLFLFDDATDTIEQVTNTIGGNIERPAISADGQTIAFISDRDLDLLVGNADGNKELFLATRPNAAPILNPIGDQAGSEGSLLSFTVTASDTDAGDTLTLTAQNLPSGANFTDNGNGTGTFNWTPTFNQAGVFPGVIFDVSDGSLTDSEIITITISNTNRAPVLDAIGPQSGIENQELQIPVSASDPDGTTPSLSADLSGLPVGNNAVFTDNGDGTGLFTWTLSFGDALGSPYSVSVLSSDGSLTDSETVPITVTEGIHPTGLSIKRLILRKGKTPNTDKWNAKGTLMLDPASDGLSPPSEVVLARLITNPTIRSWSPEAPPGTWKTLNNGKGWVFKAPKGATGLIRAKIKPTKNPGEFKWNLKAKGVDVTGLFDSNLTFNLQIGNDSGSQVLACTIKLNPKIGNPKKSICSPPTP